MSEIADAFVDRYAVVEPVRASRSMGVGRDATALTDYSPEGVGAVGALLRSTLADLDAAEPVGEAERLGAGYLHDVCAGELALIEAGERERTVSALIGPPASARMSFDVMAKDTDDDWERVAARLESVPAAMAGYRESLRAGVGSGRVASGRLVTAVVEQCETWAAGWFGTYVADHGDGPLRRRLDAAAAGAGEAYGDLARWLRDEYAPRATHTDGVGEERYGTWARAVLGKELDVDEAYGWAIDELARLEAEKDRESDRILPGAGFDAVREHLQAGGGETVDGVDAYRARLQELVDEAVEALAGVEFDIVPELRRCDVVIPPAGSAAAPYYSPPSEDLSQPGTTWFPTMGLERFPMWGEVTTVYHEAVPGHHLQMGTTRVLELTRAHRLGFNPAHGEGWALYAERLMDELGWFTAPETRLGFLCMQAFRAARVVVDIGLHTGRGEWDYERAVDAMARAGGMERSFAESEVLRYLSWPAQATSYKLGERSWLAGRAAAVAAAGSAFDRRSWHGRALALGPLGLDRLEQELAVLV